MGEVCLRGFLSDSFFTFVFFACNLIKVRQQNCSAGFRKRLVWGKIHRLKLRLTDTSRSKWRKTSLMCVESCGKTLAMTYLWWLICVRIHVLLRRCRANCLCVLCCCICLALSAHCSRHSRWIVFGLEILYNSPRTMTLVWLSSLLITQSAFRSCFIYKVALTVFLFSSV